MSLFDNIVAKAKNFMNPAIGTDLLKRLPDDVVIVEAAKRRGIDDRAKSTLLSYERLYRGAQNLKKWKEAIGAATDPEEPRWTPLWEFYDNLLLDSHVRSCIETRISYVQQRPKKLVNDAGEENQDITWLIERPWMEELVYRALMTKWSGRKLLELWDLNIKGELKHINEVPSPYFNAQLGIITKEPDNPNSERWLYKEGPYQNYYVQIGKDNELGELERLGPIILSKKLAMGSYQDYIEKYGVPPLFITTDREDDTRLNQLYEAGQNFKSNQFMVGRGNEKFEIGAINGSGTEPFSKLFDFCNDEISKAILGGSGLTDEKAFVGSSNIQFELAKNRMESDSNYFKYIFNEEIKPRLIALSPVYKVLEGYYLEYDNTEKLDMKGYVDTVQKLGTIYDIDPEQVEERTGLKILGIKQNNFTTPPPAGGEDMGK